MPYFRSFGRSYDEYTKEKQTYHLEDRSLSGYELKELFRNDQGRFTPVGYVTGAASKLDGRGFVAADLDRDGDLEIFVVNSHQPWLCLANELGRQAGNFSVVQLRGTQSNAFGVGALVTITAAGKRQVREVHAGSGYLSSPAPEAHFGLGSAQEVERIEVRWPRSPVQVIEGVDANRIVVIEEGKSWRYREPTSAAPTALPVAKGGAEER